MDWWSFSGTVHSWTNIIWAIGEINRPYFYTDQDILKPLLYLTSVVYKAILWKPKTPIIRHTLLKQVQHRDTSSLKAKGCYQAFSTLLKGAHCSITPPPFPGRAFIPTNFVSVLCHALFQYCGISDFGVGILFHLRSVSTSYVFRIEDLAIKFLLFTFAETNNKSISHFSPRTVS